MPEAEIDPTNHESLRQSPTTEFSDLSTDVQVMVREMVDDPMLGGIVIHDGGNNVISAWGPSGRWAGETADRFSEHEFEFRIYQREQTGINIEARRVGNNNVG